MIMFYFEEDKNYILCFYLRTVYKILLINMFRVLLVWIINYIFCIQNSEMFNVSLDGIDSKRNI
jgi:hypothetical protein